MRNNHRVIAAVAALTVVLSSCGDDSTEATGQVASLGSTTESASGDGTTDTVAPADTQEALLAFAACMRDNGVDMADPTFDAEGNPAGGLFGPDSGIEPGSEDFRVAQEACGELLEGVTFGGGPGGQGALDVDAVQQSMNEFTSCLRDEGLEVDDINFANGAPGGGGGPGGGGFGGPAGGTIPEGATPPDGSLPAGGFAGGPPDGGGPGGEGFDPTDRIVAQLDLDEDDPAVTAAIEACESILDGAFQPTETTTG